MVRQAQIDRRDPEGGDDQRGLNARSTRMPPTRPPMRIMALQELGSDEIGEAYVTATVTVWDEDAGIADEKLRLVEKVIEGRDFTCIMRR